MSPSPRTRHTTPRLSPRKPFFVGSSKRQSASLRWATRGKERSPTSSTPPSRPSTTFPPAKPVRNTTRSRNYSRVPLTSLRPLRLAATPWPAFLLGSPTLTSSPTGSCPARWSSSPPVQPWENPLWPSTLPAPPRSRTISQLQSSASRWGATRSS